MIECRKKSMTDNLLNTLTTFIIAGLIHRFSLFSNNHVFRVTLKLKLGVSKRIV